MPEPKIEVHLSIAERDLLLKQSSFFQKKWLARLRIAQAVPKGVALLFTAKELDEFLYELAKASLVTKNAKTGDRIDAIAVRLEEIFAQHSPDPEDEAFPDDEDDSDDLGDDGCDDDLGILEAPESQSEILKEMEKRVFDPANHSAWYLNTPTPEFRGLTINNVRELCEKGWWGTEPLIGLDLLAAAELANARFVGNMRLFLNRLAQEGGASLTPKGNLKRDFVGRMLDEISLEDGYRESIREFNKVINETDVWPLHLLRLVAEMAKLTYKKKSRLGLTAKARPLIAEPGSGELTVLLFDTYFTRLNMAYSDRLPDDQNTVQELIPYILYQLSRLEAGKEYPLKDLPGLLLPPSVVAVLGARSAYVDAEDYLWYRIVRPLAEFDLTTIRRERASKPVGPDKRFATKTDLFNRFLRMPTLAFAATE